MTGRSANSTGLSGKMGPGQIAGEEEEAVRKLRAALRNPHGTNAENRERVASAWQSLRSVATSSDVQSKSRKRDRKRSRLEDKAHKKKRIENADNLKIEGANSNSLSAKSLREEDRTLHEAARLGQADRVRELVCQGSKLTAKDNSGYSALHWASLYGHAEVVKALLRLGAGDGKRINRQNDAGNTALHLACLGHHAQVAALLRMYKPDEHLMNAYDQTPISLGLGDLLDSVEKVQLLDHLQALREDSQRQHLLSEALDWRMGRDGAYGTVREGDAGAVPSGSQGDWDDYNIAYADFIERISLKSGADDVNEERRDNSSTHSSGDAIQFQDVPWPLTGSRIPASRTLGAGRLLLAELGLAGTALRPLIQRERLRWHPDKFLQQFGRHLAMKDRDAILAGVQTVCQLLNSLADATEEA